MEARVRLGDAMGTGTGVGGGGRGRTSGGSRSVSAAGLEPR